MDQEQEAIIRNEEKVSSKLNEIGSFCCPTCKRLAVRVFEPRVGRRPVFKDDVQDYMQKMRRAMTAYSNRSNRNPCMIHGPEYTLVFAGGHFSKPYSDMLHYAMSSCYIGMITGDSPAELVYRLLLTRRSIRLACIANHVQPREIKAWLNTIPISKQSKMLGYGFSVQEIGDTGVWVATYHSRELSGHSVSSKIRKAIGSEWTAELDIVVGEPPYHYDENICPSLYMEYKKMGSYNTGIACDIPDPTQWRKLAEDGWTRVIDVELSSGQVVKIKVDTKGDEAEFIDSMTRGLHNLKAPRKFWVIQPDHVVGSTKIEEGDIVI